MTEQEKKELLRGEVLSYLAERHPLKFNAGQLQRHVANTFNASEDMLASALALLEADNLISSTVHALGATKSYCATPDGMRAFERGLL